jgi:intracellular septation protein
MRVLLDFMPIVVFFLFYTIWRDFSVATLAAIAATALQILLTYWKYKKVDKTLWFSFALMVIMGGASIFFHNPLFLQWKVSILNIGMAIGFYVSYFIFRKNPIQMLMGGQMELPEAAWRKLMHAWVGFFLLTALINLWVAYQFSIDVWVKFKLIGLLSLTFAFVIGQGVWLYKNGFLKDKV